MSQTTLAQAATRARIAELQLVYPMPPTWQLAETLVQTTTVGAIELHMVGLVATAADAATSALGSAAEPARAPVERAFFELLERISLVEARAARESTFAVRVELTGQELERRSAARVFPADLSPWRRLAVSSGTALHTTWPEACRAACAELIERDRMLRSWLGECPARPLAANAVQVRELERRLAPHYQVRAYELGDDEHASQRVVLCLLLPQNSVDPLVYGCGCDGSLTAAYVRAEREALQRLAFLWGEPLPTEAPGPSPTPDYHQDYYLYPPHHARLLAWLDGQRQRTRKPARYYDGERTVFVDLTPRGLHGVLSVAKAISPHARRLHFGPTRADAAPHPIV